MAKRADPVGVIQAEAPAALNFLTEEWGFTGPEITDDGVAYHRPGLHVQIGYWAWNHERGFTTTVTRIGRNGTSQTAQLKQLYTACGLGPPQDVPEGAGTLHVIRKRIDQHAQALRSVMPHLDDPGAEAPKR